MCTLWEMAAAQSHCSAHNLTGDAATHVVRSVEARVLGLRQLSLTGYELGARAVAPDDEYLVGHMTTLRRPVPTTR